MGEDYLIYNPDYVGRTLEDVIADLPAIGEGQLYFVGSQTGYFWLFATKDEFSQMVEKMERELIDHAKSVIDTHRRRLATYERPIQREDEKESDFRKRIDSYKGRVAVSEGQIDAWTKYIEGFAPLKDRAVKEVFSRYSHDGIAIIVEGKELGKFISYEEWRKRKPKVPKKKKIKKMAEKFATEPIPGVYMGCQYMLKPRKDNAYYAPFEGTLPKNFGQIYRRWANRGLSFASAGRFAHKSEDYMRLLFFKVQQGEIQI